MPAVQILAFSINFSNLTVLHQVLAYLKKHIFHQFCWYCNTFRLVNILVHIVLLQYQFNIFRAELINQLILFFPLLYQFDTSQSELAPIKQGLMA